MKILDRYIARQLLGVTALGVMALSALLLLGNLFKELRPLLVENKAPISIVLEFIFQVIPFSLMFSIPWGFLTAVLLVYGRLASDNELTSMRMSGMSLWRLSAPAIAIGIAESRGGIGGIAAAAVMVAGLTGAVFAPLFARLFHITDPVAEGLAIGACSHALGTTRAMEIGPVQGAMSSIAICVCGILTSILVLFL